MGCQFVISNVNIFKITSLVSIIRYSNVDIWILIALKPLFLSLSFLCV